MRAQKPLHAEQGQPHHHARRERTPDGSDGRADEGAAAKFKLRKTLAEHPFGTIKRWFGYTHFLLKGLEKVRCEWSLTTLAYNLKRVLNLVKASKN